MSTAISFMDDVKTSGDPVDQFMDKMDVNLTLIEQDA